MEIKKIEFYRIDLGDDIPGKDYVVDYKGRCYKISRGPESPEFKRHVRAKIVTEDSEVTTLICPMCQHIVWETKTAKTPVIIGGKEVPIQMEFEVCKHCGFDLMTTEQQRLHDKEVQKARRLHE